MPQIKPGTYRIVNAASDTALTVPSADWWSVVGWHREDEPRQKWFVQNSGEGYRIKNAHTRNYLAISSTTDAKSLAYCGRYPTTWILNSDPKCEYMYLIQMGDTDRVLDLDRWGARHDGNQLHAMAHNNRWINCRLWLFEHLSDETDDDDVGLKNKLAVTMSELAAKEREVAEKNALLTDKDVQLRTHSTLLEGKERDLDSMRNQLAEAASSLSKTQEALTRAEGLLETKDVELDLLRQENLNLRVAKLENESSRQQQETAELRTKLEELELDFFELTRGQQRPRANNPT